MFLSCSELNWFTYKGKACKGKIRFVIHPFAEFTIYQYRVCWNFLNESSTFTGDGIFKQSMGARNRVGIGLSYRPARLHRLAELIPWNRFLGSINV